MANRPGLGDRFLRPRLALPPADVEHDLLEPEPRHLVHQWIVLRFHRVPVPGPVAGRVEGIPLHFGIGRIPSHDLRHAVMEQMSPETVAGVVHIAGVRADEAGRHFERLAGSDFNTESIELAAAHPHPARSVSSRSGDRNPARGPFDADVHAMLPAGIEHRVRDELVLFVRQRHHLAAEGRRHLIPVDPFGVRTMTVGVKGPQGQRAFLGPPGK